MSIIKVENLTKSYAKGRVTALQGVSFDVEEGEIYGIIGPDGAGKTTLFRLLATLLVADAGTAVVDGYDVKRNYKEIRQRIGYMPGKFSLYQDLTIEENLRFFAAMFNTSMEENYHLVEDIYIQIERFKNRKAGKLSGGMKQKLALCCALIHSPRVLFLDEPTTGVDPVSRKEFWAMLKRLQSEHGLTIVVSTPYMDEAVQCDRIAMIQNGKFLKINTPQAIVESYDRSLWAVKASAMHSILSALRAFEGVETAFSFGECYHVTLKPSISIDELSAYLIEQGYDDVNIAATAATIEDCFMALMKTE